MDTGSFSNQGEKVKSYFCAVSRIKRHDRTLKSLIQLALGYIETVRFSLKKYF